MFHFMVYYFALTDRQTDRHIQSLKCIVEGSLNIVVPSAFFFLLPKCAKLNKFPYFHISFLCCFCFNTIQYACKLDGKCNIFYHFHLRFHSFLLFNMLICMTLNQWVRKKDKQKKIILKINHRNYENTKRMLN